MFLVSGWDSLMERLDGLLPEGSLRARFARGAFWAVTGVVISRLLALAASVLVARIFNSRELYGQLGMLRNTVEMFGVFAGLGLGLTATKHVAEFRRSDPARAGRIVRLSLLAASISGVAMSLVVFLFAPWIARNTLTAPALAPALRIGCGILFFETLNGVQLGTLSGFEAFKSVAKLSLIRGLATFPLMVAGARFRGLEGAVAALATAAAAGWLINRIALKRLMRREGIPPASLDQTRLELPVLWNFSVPALLTSVMGVFAPWAASALFVRKLALHPDGIGTASGLLAREIGMNPGYSALGLFNAANQWQYPVTLLATQMSIVLLPLLASFRSRPSREEERKSGRTVEAAHLVIVMIVLPTVALLSCFAGPVMSLYGPKFVSVTAVWVFWAALFVAGTKALGTIPGTLIQARGAMWTGFAINGSWAVALLVLVWTRAAGAESYANAFSMSYAAVTVVGLAYCGIVRLCTWSLILRVWLVMACLGAFSYGMAYVDSIYLRLAGFVAAAGIALGCGLVAWRAFKGQAAPADTRRRQRIS